MQSALDTFRTLTHGVSLKKKKTEERTEEDLKAAQKFTVEDSDIQASDADLILIKKHAKEVNCVQALNDPKVFEGKQEPVKKALSRYRTFVGTFLARHQLHLEGDETPLPHHSFDALKKLCPSFEGFLSTLYTSPTPIQSLAIPTLLQNRNCICIAPTGSGKTLGYGLPIIAKIITQKAKKALIVLPTFELSLQVYSVLKEMVVKTCGGDKVIVRHINKFTFGDDSEKYNAEIAGLHVLITTPLKFLNLNKIGVELTSFTDVVLDEADKYFELGFVDQFKELSETLKMAERNYALFSATLPSYIETLVLGFLSRPVSIVIRGKMMVLSSIDQKLVYCGSEFGKIVQIRNMITEGKIKTPCLVFTDSKERANQLFRQIKNELPKVRCVDGGMDRERRKKLMNEFTLGNVFMLITTDLFARGLDFPNVPLVINYDLPASPVSYIHRVGRTGRGGQKGESVSFWTESDVMLIREIAEVMQRSGNPVPGWLMEIKRGKKDQRKKLEKRGVDREAIDPTFRSEEFYKFRREMRKKDKEFKEKMDRGEEGIIQKGEKDPRVLLASHIREMEGEQGAEGDEE